MRRVHRAVAAGGGGGGSGGSIGAALAALAAFGAPSWPASTPRDRRREVPGEQAPIVAPSGQQLGACDAFRPEQLGQGPLPHVKDHAVLPRLLVVRRDARLEAEPQVGHLRLLRLVQHRPLRLLLPRRRQLRLQPPTAGLDARKAPSALLLRLERACHELDVAPNPVVPLEEDSGVEP